MATQHFKLQNISCASCVMHLEAMEDDVAGVHAVDVNYKKLSMKVEYDDGVVTPQVIEAAVKAMGYVATIDSSPQKEKGSIWNRLFHS